jgi:hypothetical protein
LTFISVAQRTLLGVKVRARLGRIGFASQRVFCFGSRGRRIVKAGGLAVRSMGRAAYRYKKESRGHYLEGISDGERTSVSELERFDLHGSLRSE